MKRLYVAVGIIFVMLISSLFVANWLESITGRCQQQLDAAQAMAERGNWEQARSITQQVVKDWKGHNFALYSTVNHDVVDEILLSFRAVEEYMKLEEMDQYTAANAVLIEQLKLLAEMERPSLENVL